MNINCYTRSILPFSVEVLVKKWTLVLLTIPIFASCIAKTDLQTIVRPEWSPHSFNRILVFHNSGDLGERKTIEDQFSAANTAFVAAHEVLFPGEDYSESEVRGILQDNRIDAVLLVDPAGQGSSTSVIPGQMTTRCTVTVDGECQQTRTTATGPTTIAKPYANFSAQLLELETGTVVWTASAESGGNAFTDQDDLRKSLVSEIIEEFRSIGIVASPDDTN